MAKRIWNVAGLAINPVNITPSDAGDHEHEILQVRENGVTIRFTPYGAPLTFGSSILRTFDEGFYGIPFRRIWANGTTATEITGWTQG